MSSRCFASSATARIGVSGSSQFHTPPPEQHAAVLVDARDDALHRAPLGLRRLRIDAEWDDGDEALERGVGRVLVVSDPAQAAEDAQPEVALPVAGAQKRAARREGQDLLEHRRAESAPAYAAASGSPWWNASASNSSGS